jgi:hypothetical protein
VHVLQAKRFQKAARRRTGIEEDEAVGADEVDAAAAGFGGEEEDKVLSVLRVVELVDELLALLDCRTPLEAEVAVAGGRVSSERAG